MVQSDSDSSNDSKMASSFYWTLNSYWLCTPYRIQLLTTGSLIVLTALVWRYSKRVPERLPKPTTTACRYRLDNSTSASLTLPDGRQLGYAQYGSPNGKVVFLLHGLPGSRIEGAFFDDIAKQQGARIISMDRPGYGWSSPQPGRSLVDHAKDVQYLAEYLGFDEYGVLVCSVSCSQCLFNSLLTFGLEQANSGGGPYALACAYALPSVRLQAVSIVCGLGLFDMSRRGMDLMHYLGFTVGFRYFPSLCRWYFSRDPASNLELSDEERLELWRQNLDVSKTHPKDLEFLGDIDMMRSAFAISRQSFAQGLEAFALDGQLLCMDPKFRVEDIRTDLPINLWYGELDRSVPVGHGEETARRLKGDKVRLHVKDETHSSLQVNWWPGVLQELLASM